MWEYKVVIAVKTDDLEPTLNDMGKDNWELVSVNTVPQPHELMPPPRYVATLKRRTAPDLGC